MASLGEGKTVCVTGASGYIAGHLVALLLKEGYTVHGTVRSLDNEEAVGPLKALPGAAERLRLFTADLLEAGSFDAALTGCDGVFHTASPFFRRDCRPEELIRPAVEGTKAVYAACARVPSIKRVVTTSSFAAIIFGHDHTTDPTPYTEAEWNTVSTAEPGNTMHIYRVSKTEAERAGWAFLEEAKPGFDIVTINPPIVIGPFLPGYHRQNDSSMIVAEYLRGDVKEAPCGGMGFIDVRDVADAHYQALVRPGAQGRYLVCGESLTFAAMCAVLRELYPDSACTQAVAAAAPDGSGPILKPEFDCSKAARDLGWKGRPAKESLQAQADALKACGFW